MNYEKTRLTCSVFQSFPACDSSTKHKHILILFTLKAYILVLSFENLILKQNEQ